MTTSASSLQRWLVAVLALALVIAAVLACQKNVARFPHRQHLGMDCSDPSKPCLTCLSCHGGIVEGKKQGHPTSKNCASCHKDMHAADDVLNAPVSPARKQATAIKFDHAKHLDMPQVGGQCITCHAGVVSEKVQTTFPPMSACFGCHEHQEQWDKGTCTPCHEQADLSHLFPQTLLKHGPGWDRRHATEAAASTLQCAACHTTESCDDCHDVTQDLKPEQRHAEKVDKDFVHPADFLTRHSMEAASEPARCLSCHRTETCDSCHISRGVSAARMGAVNPHPPGWVGPDGSNPAHHGRAARRDVLACATCHDQGPATNCIGCHRPGGAGGNPHPSGWHSSRTPDDVMCAYCHEGQ